MTRSAVSLRPKPISTSVESESCALARWLRIAPFGLPVVRIAEEILIRAIARDARGAAEHDVVAFRNREIAAHLLGARHQLVLHDEGARLAVLGDVADFRPDQTEVHRHRDEPGLGDG